MTREEFERIKEAEKEHLRALKKLRQTVRGLERRQSVNKAISDIASSTGSILDKHTELVEKLGEETAMQEARLEIAMESLGTDEAEAQLKALEAEAEAAKFEESQQKDRARDLVQQVKDQMGSAPEGRTAPEQRPPTDRTIGRTKADPGSERKPDAPRAADETMPEKTIGRMKRR